MKVQRLKNLLISRLLAELYDKRRNTGYFGGNDFG